MRPTLLRLTKIRIHRRIVTDHQANERVRIEDLCQRVGVLVYAKQEYARLLRQKRPHAVDAPTRLVRMHYHRVSQQRTQDLELILPMPRQLAQQAIRLSFTEFQILQELQGQTNFVKGQPHDINEVSDLNDDLHAEFAATEHTGNLAVLLLGTAIDLISDEGGTTVFQTPHRPSMRQLTLFRRKALRKTLLRA